MSCVGTYRVKRVCIPENEMDITDKFLQVVVMTYIINIQLPPDFVQ
jgi:hypothetical protein